MAARSPRSTGAALLASIHIPMSTRLLRRTHLMVLLLAGLAFGLRIWNLTGQSLWRDEVDALRFSLQPLGRLAQLFVTPGHNGPLYYLVLRPWLHLAGQSEFALRYFSLLWGVLCLPLLYRVARHLGSRRSALVAALLATVSPYLVWYSQEGKMYSLVTALTLAATLVWLNALSRGGPGWRWVVYAVLVTSSVYVHFLAVLMLPVHGLLAWPHRERRRPALLTLAALALPYAPLAVWQLPLLLEPAETGYPFVPLHDLLAGLATQHSLGVLPAEAIALLPFLGLALAAFYPSRPPSSAPGHVAGNATFVLVVWLLLPPASLFLISLSRPIFTERYLIFILPAWLLLQAAGTWRLAQLNRLLAGAVLVAVLALDARSLWLQATTPIKSDLRAATGYVLTHRDPSDLILFQIPYARFGFDYYVRRQPAPPARDAAGRFVLWLPRVTWGTQRGSEEPGFYGGYPWAEGPYTNHGQPPDEVARQMERLTAGHRVVWLFETESALWDARGLTRAWLDEHARPTDKAHFSRVSVFRYELPP
jgi:mannosyltransferase